MDLWARINGKDYPIVFGAPVTDNFNDTLDSMMIQITHLSEILSAKPFDDVIIHSYGPELKDSNGNLISGLEYEYNLQNFSYGSTIFVPREGTFYRHMVFGNVNRSQVDLTNGYFDYSLPLKSEISGLEKIIMPNRTITQPIGRLGRTVLFWIQSYLDSYCPKKKLTNGDGTFYFVNKYGLSQKVRDTFSKIYAPEDSFNSTTLREALTKLFSTADMIPVVHDWVIDCYDIATRVGDPIPIKTIKRKDGSTFDLPNIPGMNFIGWTLSGDDYCDRVRRNYSGALSSDSTTHLVEKVGFRNKDVATMTLQDLKVSLGHRCYKIDKIKMCYYKMIGTDHYALVHRDITPFVVLNARRSLLSVDWNEFIKNPPTTIEGYYDDDKKYVKGYADYRFCTVGYDIGSTDITGWGEFLQYTETGIMNLKMSYLENLIGICESTLGYQETIDKIFNVGDIINLSYTSPSYKLSPDYFSKTDPTKNIISPAVWNSNDKVTEDINSIISFFTGKDIATLNTPKMKTVFFEVEYEGYIDSAVIFSKDYHDGDVTVADNASSSLSIIEEDGIHEKEKVNQLGNEVLAINARVTDPTKILELGRYDANDNILYRRVVSVSQGFFEINYFFCKDYVLKNFFTSVYSKHRPYALATYNDSVQRLENHSVEVVFSPDTSYYQGSFSSSSVWPSIDKILSFFKTNDKSYMISHSSIIHSWIPDYIFQKFSDLKNINFSENDIVFIRADETKFSGIVFGRYWAPNSFTDASGKEVTKSKDSIYYDTVLNTEYRFVMKDPSKKTTDSSIDYIYKESSDIISSIYQYIDGNLVFLGNHNLYEEYSVDSQNYISGYSLCYTVSMVDNESAGTYIRQVNPGFNDYIWQVMENTAKKETADYSLYEKKNTPLNDITGMVQDWYMINEDQSGYVSSLKFSSFSIDEQSEKNALLDTPYSNALTTASEKLYAYYNIYSVYNNYIFKLPFINSTISGNSLLNSSTPISCVERDKDAKEKITSTMQIEPISDDSGEIQFSELISKLSNLNNKLGKYWKNEKSQMNSSFIISATNITMPTQENYSHGYSTNKYARTFFLPLLGIVVPSKIVSGKDLGHLQGLVGKEIKWDSTNETFKNSQGDTKTENGGMATLSVVINSIVSIKRNSLTINVTMNSKSSTEENSSTRNIELINSQKVVPVESSDKIIIEEVSIQETGKLYRLTSYPPAYINSLIDGYVFYSYNFYDVIKQVLGGETRDPSDFLSSYVVINGVKGNVSNDVLYDSYEHNPNLDYSELDVGRHYGLYETKFECYDDSSKESTDIPRNLFAFYCPSPMLPSTYYHTMASIEDGFYETSDFKIGDSLVTDNPTLSYDSNGAPCIKMSCGVPSGRSDSEGSLRIYYYDDRDLLYHFVYGQNFHAKDVSDGVVSVKAYVSMVENRSKTVYDLHGNPFYRIFNYASDSGHNYGIGNYCVKKD